MAASSAWGVQRTFKFHWVGIESVDYTATDSTAFNEQRAGLTGCDYTQNGDTTVFWADDWRFTADVKPKSGHVKIGSIKRLDGPVPKHANRGDSEISGNNTNEGTSTQCSDAKLAGSYDCTAEKVTPRWIGKGENIAFNTSNVPKAWDLSVPSFSDARASYEGDAPNNYDCATRVGRNHFPGGFTAADIGLGSTEAQFRLRHSDLAELKLRKEIKSTLEDSSSPGWAFEYPVQGDDCALEETDETCTYGSDTSLFGKSVITRVRNLKSHAQSTHR